MRDMQIRGFRWSLVPAMVLLGAVGLGVAGCWRGGISSDGSDETVAQEESQGPEIPILPADDHGDTRSDATALALGKSVPGKIEMGGDEDFFRVDVPGPGSLTVFTIGDLDTVGELQRGDGTYLAGDDDSGELHNFRIVHDVVAGTHYVRIGSYDASAGSYVVQALFTAERITDDHGDTRSSATALALGDSVPGKIEEGGDEDFFRVEVTEPGSLTVYTTGDLDTVGELQRGDGTYLAGDDDSGELHNFRIEQEVVAGTYYVRIGSYDEAAGSYVVQALFTAERITDDHGNTRSNATALALGDSVPGKIEEGGDEDFFRVEVTEPGSLTVYTSGDLDTAGELQRGDGTYLAGDDDSGELHNFRIEHDVVVGTYFVRVGSYGVATGSYVVQALFTAGLITDDHGDTRSTATALALGDPVSGEIQESGDEDFFRVDVPGSGTLTVYTTGHLDTVGELQRGDGTYLTHDDDSGGQGNFRIEQDVGPGTYYVKVGGFGTAAGSYVVLARFTPAQPADDHGDIPSEATTLTLGGAVSGEIEVKDDEDFFRVEVPESGVLTVYTTGSLDTVGELFGGDGSSLVTNDEDGTQRNFSIEYDAIPGTYYVKVSSNLKQVGSYTINAEIEIEHSDTPANATPIDVGQGFSGRMDSATDVDYFRLLIDAPGRLTVGTTGDANPNIAVFDADGIEIPGIPGSWTGDITQDHLKKGRHVVIELSGGNAGKKYSGRVLFERRDEPRNQYPVVGQDFERVALTLTVKKLKPGQGQSRETVLKDCNATVGGTSGLIGRCEVISQRGTKVARWQNALAPYFHDPDTVPGGIQENQQLGYEVRCAALGLYCSGAVENGTLAVTVDAPGILTITARKEILARTYQIHVIALDADPSKRLLGRVSQILSLTVRVEEEEEPLYDLDVPPDIVSCLGKLNFGTGLLCRNPVFYLNTNCLIHSISGDRAEECRCEKKIKDYFSGLVGDYVTKVVRPCGWPVYSSNDPVCAGLDECVSEQAVRASGVPEQEVAQIVQHCKKVREDIERCQR